MTGTRTLNPSKSPRHRLMAGWERTFYEVQQSTGESIACTKCQGVGFEHWRLFVIRPFVEYPRSGQSASGAFRHELGIYVQQGPHIRQIGPSRLMSADSGRINALASCSVGSRDVNREVGTPAADHSQLPDCVHHWRTAKLRLHASTCRSTFAAMEGRRGTSEHTTVRRLGLLRVPESDAAVVRYRREIEAPAERHGAASSAAFGPSTGRARAAT